MSNSLEVSKKLGNFTPFAYIAAKLELEKIARDMGYVLTSKGGPIFGFQMNLVAVSKTPAPMEQLLKALNSCLSNVRARHRPTFTSISYTA